MLLNKHPIRNIRNKPQKKKIYGSNPKKMTGISTIETSKYQKNQKKNQKQNQITQNKNYKLKKLKQLDKLKAKCIKIKKLWE